jgi:hypothetical protein
LKWQNDEIKKGGGFAAFKSSWKKGAPLDANQAAIVRCMSKTATTASLAA